MVGDGGVGIVIVVLRRHRFFDRKRHAIHRIILYTRKVKGEKAGRKENQVA